MTTAVAIKCTGTLKSGAPCQANAKRGSDRCGRHQTDNSDAQKRAAALDLIASTMNVTAACRSAGLGRSTFYEWVDADAEFAAAAKDAKSQCADNLEGALYERGVEGVVEPVFDKDGNHVADRRKYSDTAAIFLLKGLRPETYRERHEVSGTVQHDHRIDWQATRANLADALDQAAGAIEATSREAV